MARRRKTNSKSYNVRSDQRDDSYTIANTRPEPLPAVLSGPPDVFILPRSSLNLRFVEDRRTWYPTPFRPAATLRGPNYKLRVVSPPPYAKRPAKAAKGRLGRVAHPGLRPEALQLHRPGWAGPPVHVGFKTPASVMICVRREQRKEVLFAKSKGRAPGRPKRRPRKNSYSSISCRRT